VTDASQRNRGVDFHADDHLHLKILINTYAHDRSFLSITPGEETEWGCVAKVARDQACIVEVVVLGSAPKRLLRPITGQWRASCASLPVPTVNRDA
jgi:hypothetical protein